MVLCRHSISQVLCQLKKLLGSENGAAVRWALLLADVPRVERIHGIVFFVTLHVVHPRQFRVLFNFVQKTHLELLFLLVLFARRLLALLRRIQFYYWCAVPVEALLRCRLCRVEVHWSQFLGHVGTAWAHRRWLNIVLVILLVLNVIDSAGPALVIRLRVLRHGWAILWTANSARRSACLLRRRWLTFFFRNVCHFFLWSLSTIISMASLRQ